MALKVLRRSVRSLIAALSNQKILKGDIVTSPGRDAFLKLLCTCILCCTLLIAGAIRFRDMVGLHRFDSLHFRAISASVSVSQVREEAQDHSIELQRGIREPWI